MHVHVRMETGANVRYFLYKTTFISMYVFFLYHRVFNWHIRLCGQQTFILVKGSCWILALTEVQQGILIIHQKKDKSMLCMNSFMVMGFFVCVHVHAVNHPHVKE